MVKRIKCHGLNRKDKRCGNYAEEGSLYCRQHFDQDPEYKQDSSKSKTTQDLSKPKLPLYKRPSFIYIISAATVISLLIGVYAIYLSKDVATKDDIENLKVYRAEVDPADVDKEIRSQEAQDSSKIEKALTAYHQGVEYYEDNKFDKAIYSFSEAINSSPVPKLYLSRGNAYFSKNDFTNAVNDYTHAIDLNPNFVGALNNRGIAFEKIGEREKAFLDYSRAAELDPSFAAGPSCNIGRYWSDLGKHDKAITYYNKAIKEDSEFEVAYILRGLSYSKTSRYNLAIDDFTNAIRLIENRSKRKLYRSQKKALSKVYYYRGIALARISNDDKAKKDFFRSIDLDPGAPEAYVNLGIVMAKEGNYEGAIEKLSKGIELDNQYGFAFYNRGFAYYKLGQYNNAIDDFSSAIRLNSEYAEAYQKRCLCYFKLGEYEKAIDDCDESIEIEPNKHEAYNNRGLAKRGIYNIAGAIEDFIEAIRNDPTAFEPYMNLAESYLLLNRKSEALGELEHYLKIAKEGDPNIDIVKARIKEIQAASGG